MQKDAQLQVIGQVFTDVDAIAFNIEITLCPIHLTGDAKLRGTGLKGVGEGRKAVECLRDFDVEGSDFALLHTLRHVVRRLQACFTRGSGC